MAERARGQCPSRPTLLAAVPQNSVTTMVWLCNPFKGGCCHQPRHNLWGNSIYKPILAWAANINKGIFSGLFEHPFLKFLLNIMSCIQLHVPMSIYDDKHSIRLRFDSGMQHNTCPQKFAAAQLGFTASCLASK